MRILYLYILITICFFTICVFFLHVSVILYLFYKKQSVVIRSRSFDLKVRIKNYSILTKPVLFCA